MLLPTAYLGINIWGFITIYIAIAEKSTEKSNLTIVSATLHDPKPLPFVAVSRATLHPRVTFSLCSQVHASGLGKGVVPVDFSDSQGELDQSYSRYPPLRPRDKNASIEQLLNEIERECGGPDYRYIPRQFSTSPLQDDTDSISSVGSGARISAKTNLKSTQNGAPLATDPLHWHSER